MERVDEIKKLVFVVFGVYSVESFGMKSNLLNVEGRNRTYSDCFRCDLEVKPERTRSFSESPKETSDVKDRKDSKVRENQIILIQADAIREKVNRGISDRSNGNGYVEFGIEDFECKGRLSNGKMSGEGKIIHKSKIVTVEGWFCENFLDLSKRVKVMGANRNKSYIFEQTEWIDDLRYRQLISVEDVIRVKRSLSYDGSLCLRFDGGKEGLVFSSGFVYKGTLHNDEITGEGTMVKNTGEILKGRFYRGIYKAEK